MLTVAKRMCLGGDRRQATTLGIPLRVAQIKQLMEKKKIKKLSATRRVRGKIK